MNKLGKNMGTNIFFHGTEEGERVGMLTCNDLKFIINFRRTSGYRGGFGFDWIRNDFKSICSNYEELEREYRSEMLDGTNDYFIPWLSVFSNYNSDIDPVVQLELEIIPIDGKWRKSTIEFACPSGITIAPIEVTHKMVSAPPVITINCNSVHAGGTIIIKTVASTKEPTSMIVGKMNVVPNEECPLRVRIVSLLRESCENADRKCIAEKIDAVITHLTKGYLQQACIKVATEIKEMTIDDLILQTEQPDPKRPGETIIYIGKRRNTPQELLNKHQMVLPNDDGASDTEYLNEIVLYQTDTIFAAYREQFSSDPFNGIVVILSDFTYLTGAGGVGIFHPTKRNECVIYNMSDYSTDNHPTTILHEIGHLLGLDHIFERNLNEFLYDKSKSDLIKNESEIAKMTAEIPIYKAMKEDWEAKAEIRRKNRDVRNEQTCRQNAKNNQDMIDSLNYNIKICNQNIAIHQEYVDSYEYLYSLPDFGFRKYSTDNIMDYNKMFGQKLICFFKWQWDRMRHEIKTYHS